MNIFRRIWIAALIYGCHPPINHDLGIPEMVVHKAGSETPIPGTRLLIHIPDGFTFNHRTLYLDSSASIHLLYSSGLDLNDSTEVIRRNFESAHQKFYYVREFKLDSADAQIYYTPCETAGTDRIDLFLQSGTFSAAAMATFQNKNASIRDSVLTALLSIHADEQMPLEIAGLESFTFDLTQSEFAYSNHVGTAFLYTIDGQDNPSFKIDRDEIMVIQFPPGEGGTLKDKISRTLKMYASARLTIVNRTFKNTFVRAEPACEYEGNIKYQDKSGKMYVISMGTSKHMLVFSALLYSDVERRLNEVIYIAHSLEFKRGIGN